METLKYTSQVLCHQNLPVNAVCIHATCNGVLCCAKCLLFDHSHDQKSVLSISELVNRADVHYEIMRNIKSVEEPPLELKELVTKQDECLAALTTHIEKEKDTVNKIIDDGQKSFIHATTVMKNDIFKELDGQIGMLHSNFSIYKSLFNGFYRGDQEKFPEYPSLAEIMSQINNIDDRKELETKMKQFLLR
jgi:hypothetical protein